MRVQVWKGGEWSEETILQNIPSGHSVTVAVKLAMCANLLLMTPYPRGGAQNPAD